ncbi:MAG: helix-turn-helix domain-containing protein [Oscillospiraceae bacterium]|nr:helix-turn-helix domain-containing protein [Oscillospiraceae bacterium]
MEAAATIPRATKSTIEADWSELVQTEQVQTIKIMIFTVKYDYYRDYPEKIKAYRDKHGITQKQLAALMGVRYPAVSKWERGVTKPSYAYWQRFRGLIEKDFYTGD